MRMIGGPSPPSTAKSFVPALSNQNSRIGLPWKRKRPPPKKRRGAGAENADGSPEAAATRHVYHAAWPIGQCRNGRESFGRVATVPDGAHFERYVANPACHSDARHGAVPWREPADCRGSLANAARHRG